MPGIIPRARWRTSSRPSRSGAPPPRRALRRLNPVKVATQKVPVVFEPRVAASLVGNLFEAVSRHADLPARVVPGRKAGRESGQREALADDDATIPGLFGTSPFDDEGVASRRTVVLERGVLKSYLLNTYAARKLGMKTTGNASRGLAGNAGIGHGNFFVENGVQSPERIIARIADGFYVTELIGMGVNIVTGDYSRGAAGLWIRNGELAFAVSEVTIAGNLQDMLFGRGRGWQRPGVSRFRGRAHAQDWRNDRWRQIKPRARTRRPARNRSGSRFPRRPSSSCWCWRRA